jgi:hypothetical protein
MIIVPLWPPGRDRREDGHAGVLLVLLPALPRGGLCVRVGADAGAHGGHSHDVAGWRGAGPRTGQPRTTGDRGVCRLGGFSF